jgi:hypothetical protein
VSDKNHNQWRQVVAWLLCHREVLDKEDACLCEELISLVALTDKHHGELLAAYRRAIEATDSRSMPFDWT